ncbi:conserved hypothetical protein, partial [Ricinus communis]
MIGQSSHVGKQHLPYSDPNWRMRMDHLEIPLNPEYGHGFFIRSLYLTTPQTGHVLLGMEDMGHAFQIHFEHNGETVTAIDARWHRHPVSTCSGAPQALQALVGCPLSGSVLAPQHFSDPLQHCTHMFDMMRLAMVHAWHRRSDCRYDVIIRDSPSGQPQTGELMKNGELKFRLIVSGDTIVAPERCRGASLTRGFGRWAKDHLDDETLEYVFMLQRSFFIAHGRRRNYSVLNAKVALSAGLLVGVCHATKSEHYAEAMRLDTVKDYSKMPEQILQFFPLTEFQPAVS